MLNDVVNAKIKSLDIYNDRGALCLSLHLTYGLAEQAFGAYHVHLPSSKKNEGYDHTGAFIFGILKAAGVDAIHQLPGKIIRVQRVNGLIEAVGNALEEVWFSPKQEEQL